MTTFHVSTLPLPQYREQLDRCPLRGQQLLDAASVFGQAGPANASSHEPATKPETGPSKDIAAPVRGWQLATLVFCFGGQLSRDRLSLAVKHPACHGGWRAKKSDYIDFAVAFAWPRPPREFLVTHTITSLSPSSSIAPATDGEKEIRNALTAFFSSVC
jgi:hypothetical protein